MAIYKTKGIVLKARPFDESAKIITIFTIDFGKVNVIAKGAKRPNSKFGGRLEPLNVLELSVAKGRNLDILSQCETIENYSGIKNKHDKNKKVKITIFLTAIFIPPLGTKYLLFHQES